jgi:hypothetical protein
MKLKKAICLTLVLIFIAITPVCCFGIRKTAKRQLDEVTKLATKRFVEEGHINRGETEKGKYTGLTVYPLYDENDEMQYFLIDLEPSGYAYVSSNIKIRNSMSCLGRIIASYGEYTVSYGRPWYRYYRNETDTDYDLRDAEILYEDSHFRVANIGDEKRYLLKCYPKSGSFGYIPAVKRGDKFLNLVSMTEYDPNDLYAYEPTSGISFMPAHAFDL